MLLVENSTLLISGLGRGIRTSQDLVHLGGKGAAELCLLRGSQLDLVQDFALSVDALKPVSGLAELDPTSRIGVSGKALGILLAYCYNSYIDGYI